MVESKYAMKMKRTNKILFPVLALMLLAGGCRKQFETVDAVDFEVSTATQTFKVGESVRFHFEGNPDFIIFYSGETGNEYAFKDKDRITETEMTFTFTTTTSSGTPGYPNPARVPICYSTDFSGEYTEEAVRAATWIDITDQFNQPTDTGVNDLLSGDVNISRYYPDEETPLYFSFHYVVDPYDASAAGGEGNGRTQWNYKSPQFNGVVGETSEVLYDMASSNWQIVLASSFEGASSLPDINTYRVLLRSEFTPAVSRECWAICGPIYKMDQINEGPDHGVGIKAMADASLASYDYIYETPGEYTVTFVGANANVYDRKEVVRTLKIQIVEDEGGITPPEPGEWNQ